MPNPLSGQKTTKRRPSLDSQPVVSALTPLIGFNFATDGVGLAAASRDLDNMVDRREKVQIVPAVQSKA